MSGDKFAPIILRQDKNLLIDYKIDRDRNFLISDYLRFNPWFYWAIHGYKKLNRVKYYN